MLMARTAGEILPSAVRNKQDTKRLFRYLAMQEQKKIKQICKKPEPEPFSEAVELENENQFLTIANQMNQKLIQLYQAIATRNLEQIQHLIADGIDVNALDVEDRMTPLAKAVLLGNVEIAQVLIQAGADLYKRNDSEDDTPLSLAAQSGNLEMVELLLQAGARVDFGGFKPPLYYAVESNHIPIVQALISAGANVSLRHDEGYTSLMRAAELGHLEAVRLLVNAGANVNIANKDGGTAMSIAAWAGEQHIVEYLSPFCSSEDREYAAQVLPLGIRKKQRREDT